MAYRVNDKWACSYCGKIYNHGSEADACRESHEIVYMQISRTDLNRIINFIMLRDESLITEALINNLRRYARANQS